MPKQVNPLSVLKPAAELSTSIRVRAQRVLKHVRKLQNENSTQDEVVLMNAALRVLASAEILENVVKVRLAKEKRL